MFNHYFIDKEHSKDDFFTFEEKFENHTVKLKSCDNVFSKNEIDYGSKVLIKAIIKYFNLDDKKCLDLGCGLGVVSIILSKYFNAEFTLTDITEIAIKLSKENLKLNNCKSFNIIKSDLFENVSEKFDFIITNPPIRAGKQLLLKLIKESVNYLNKNGKLVLVIRKSHGEESIKKYMETIFNNVEILARDKGFYVLKGENNDN